MNSLLKNTLLTATLLASLSSNANTPKLENIDNIRNSNKNPSTIQVVIAYVSLDIEFESLMTDWNAKYAYTDSSVADYNEVKKFVSTVERHFNKANKLMHIAKEIDQLSNEATGITKSYKSFVAQGYRYLNNIEKDNKLRSDITKAMNNSLLSYDEDIIATLDRMKDMIKNDIETDKIREDKINAK
jgi:hypothetical protein